jgi:putative SOS response-associated peptidase YedK
MCGRYSITTNPEAMRQLFRFLNATPNIRPRYNAAPTDELPVVRLDREGNRELVMLRWGLVARSRPGSLLRRWSSVNFYGRGDNLWRYFTYSA